MKDPFLELQVLSQELWNEVKAIRYNACNKKRTILRIEKLVIKIKALDFDSEINIIKETENKKERHG